MTAGDRKRLVTLGLLATALVVVVAWQFTGGSGTAGSPAATRSARARAADRTAAEPATPAPGRRRPAGTAAVDPADLEVHLPALEAVAPEPADAVRNPFRFGVAPAVERTSATPARPSSSTPTMSTPIPISTTDDSAGPPQPPPPPPISLKFIGVLSQAAAGRIAVLSDGRYVYHGREGDIIDGRYRVVTIDEESVQMEHADGRGRQRIRLSGS